MTSEHSSKHLIREMDYPGSSVRLIRFGPFEFDAASLELRRRGVRVRIQGQPLRVLALLLSRPGTLVTRDTLGTALWPEGGFTERVIGELSLIHDFRVIARSAVVRHKGSRKDLRAHVGLGGTRIPHVGSKVRPAVIGPATDTWDGAPPPPRFS
jgi:hypothetical protein